MVFACSTDVDGAADETARSCAVIPPMRSTTQKARTRVHAEMEREWHMARTAGHSIDDECTQPASKRFQEEGYSSGEVVKPTRSFSRFIPSTARTERVSGT